MQLLFDPANVHGHIGLEAVRAYFMSRHLILPPSNRVAPVSLYDAQQSTNCGVEPLHPGQKKF